MELRHLRYLVAGADGGTFVAAAQLLRVAQPALTRQVHDLERELGVPLFEKGARKATLTKAGEACVRLARHVIHDTERAMTRARLSDEGLVGECVVLAGVVPLASGFAGLLAARIKAKYPGITLTIAESEGGDQWERLVKGEADVGLSVTPPLKFPALAIETQGSDWIEHALLHEDHPMAARRSVTIAELCLFPSLMPEGAEGSSLWAVVRQYQSMVSKLGRGEATIEYYSSFHAILAHVRAMRGWVFIPKSLHDKYPPLIAVPISDFRMPYSISRTWRRADDRPVIRTVVNELRAMEREQLGTEPPPPKRTPRERKPHAPLPARLELRHLRSYAQVARFGSFGRAADAMELTQPALSRQMKELEFDVGVALFERGTRGVELTTAGQAFLADVNGVLTIAEHMKREAGRAQRGTTQHCVVGVVPHPHVDRLVADLVSEVESHTKFVRIGTRMLGTPSMPAALEHSEIDVALGFAYPIRVPPNPNVIRVRLFDDEMSYALLAPNHPLAGSTSLSVAELSNVPLLFPPRSTFPPVHSVVMHEFDRLGVQPRIDGTYEGVVTIWAMAAQGLGWALGLREQAADPPMGLVSIPLRDFKLPWGGELVYRKDESRAPILAVIDVIVARANHVFTPKRVGTTTPVSTPAMPAGQ
ncbi:MAG TPA: LysR family transcriptional regulator [Gemmatimonadaceae bacterium]